MGANERGEVEKHSRCLPFGKVAPLHREEIADCQVPSHLGVGLHILIDRPQILRQVAPHVNVMLQRAEGPPSHVLLEVAVQARLHPWRTLSASALFGSNGAGCVDMRL